MSAGNEILLQPGQWWFGSDAARVRTVLGSCVAVTLWHPRRRLGGMCHYMLPGRGTAATAPPDAYDGRYGDEVLACLVREVERSGGRAQEYEAKLFGGGRMFRPAPGAEAPGVPDRNVQTGRELLLRHGFGCVAEDVGGYGHREVILEMQDGQVWVRHTPLRDGAFPFSTFGGLL